MAVNINTVVLSGNLTRDPELRHTPAGNPVAEFGIAVNGREKDSSGEWVDRPDFFDVTAWGRTAEVVCEYASKGSPVTVAGRLRQDRWQNDRGENRSKVKVTADRVQLHRGGDNTGGGGGESSYAGGDFAPPTDDSDIPF